MRRSTFLLLASSVALSAGCMASSADFALPPPSSGSYGGPWDDEAAEPRPRFEAVGTNPFVMAAHDPFSTFAADVDTASYDIFTREAELGHLPPPESVRLEEYVNSFDYDYPAPPHGAEVPFAIDLAAAAHPLRPSIAQLRVGIQAASPPEFVQLPTNLVFLVDTSGSMQRPDKLPLVQTLIRESLSQLGPSDTVSIVTYAGSTEVRLAPTPARDAATIRAVVDGLTAGGGTNGASGIHLAYAQAEAGFIEGGFNHVVLCTDGDFNIGVTSTDELVSLIEDERRTGVTLTALGFGRDNLNDTMMERISNAGNGIYSVIVSEEHAIRYAREDLLRTAHFVAKDMKIQVEFNPEHVLAYRLLGYENRALDDDDFRDDVVDAGEVGAGHRVTALYEVVLVGQSIPEVAGAPEVLDGEPVDGERTLDASELVRVRVRWKDLDASETDPAYETSASLGPDDLGAADPDFLWAAAIAAFAELVKESPYADPAHVERIAAIVAAQAGRDADRARFSALFDRIRAAL